MRQLGNVALDGFAIYCGSAIWWLRVSCNVDRVKHARKAFAQLQAANAAREAFQIIAAALGGIIVRGVVQLYDSTRAQKRLQARLMVLLPFHELSSGNRKPS